MFSTFATRFRSLLRLPSAAGVGLLLAGCSALSPSAAPPTVVRAAQPAELPPPQVLQMPPVAPPPPHAAVPKPLPISLDTVLRLAQDQNGQINLAREKVEEAFATRALAGKAWLPDVYVGTSFYRHEGGIQNEDGRLIDSSFGSLFAGLELRGRFDVREATFKKVDAERKIWQQRAELSRLSSENLLEAANTYVDLLAARTGEAVGLGMKSKLQELLKDAMKLAQAEPGAQVEVSRIQTEIAAQEQIIAKLRQGATAAAAKLVYLLGLDPHAELVVVDRRLVPFTLIDQGVPLEVLLQKALTQGPGVRELEGLLALIEESRAKASGPGRLLPVFEIGVVEGGFGAGPGASLNWENRLDLLLQARWNLTELATATERRRIVQSKTQQAHLTYQDLRGKLTMGVQEARAASASGTTQMRLGETQIEHAQEAYRLSEFRRQKGIKGASFSEVLLAIRALGGAQLNYLNAIREYDKAQVRLLVLTGGISEPTAPHPAHPVPHHPPHHGPHPSGEVIPTLGAPRYLPPDNKLQ